MHTCNHKQLISGSSASISTLSVGHLGCMWTAADAWGDMRYAADSPECTPPLRASRKVRRGGGGGEVGDSDGDDVGGDDDDDDDDDDGDDVGGDDEDDGDDGDDDDDNDDNVDDDDVDDDIEVATFGRVTTAANNTPKYCDGDDDDACDDGACDDDTCIFPRTSSCMYHTNSERSQHAH